MWPCGYGAISPPASHSPYVWEFPLTTLVCKLPHLGGASEYLISLYNWCMVTKSFLFNTFSSLAGWASVYDMTEMTHLIQYLT